MEWINSGRFYLCLFLREIFFVHLPRFFHIFGADLLERVMRKCKLEGNAGCTMESFRLTGHWMQIVASASNLFEIFSFSLFRLHDSRQFELAPDRKRNNQDSFSLLRIWKKKKREKWDSFAQDEQKTRNNWVRLIGNWGQGSDSQCNIFFLTEINSLCHSKQFSRFKIFEMRTKLCLYTRIKAMSHRTFGAHKSRLI